MKAIDLRKKTKSELQALLREKREKLVRLRFDLVAGKIKNMKEMQSVRKDIARILTILKEK